jgi:tyrosyl-tRNA synthetase
MSLDLFADLEWRGLLAQTTDREALVKELKSAPTKFYIGFDPTAPSLHVGNLVVILVMRRFQLAGHLPIALVGGATGLVGDPSGRNEERTLNDESVVLELVGNIKNQLSKDSVASRLESGGISYTEFSYQVLQAFDYLELYRRDKCRLQLGGSDQWGNIVAGLDLIRKVEGGSAHAFTIPLMAKSDGSKFGKTAGGSVWLDPEMTSPYAFYQFWFNTEDADVEKYLKVFSFKDRAEIERLIETVKTNPGAREAQKELARELTAMVHGSDQSEKVEAASSALFGQGELNSLDEKT